MTEEFVRLGAVPFKGIEQFLTMPVDEDGTWNKRACANCIYEHVERELMRYFCHECIFNPYFKNHYQARE